MKKVFLLLIILLLVGCTNQKSLEKQYYKYINDVNECEYFEDTKYPFDINITLGLIIVGAIGSFLGARLSSTYLPSQRVKQLFGVLIVVMTVYRIYMFI